MLKKIYFIYARGIPNKFQDDCLDIDDEFPLHDSTGVVRLYDDNNPFVE